jgi:omega-6 fatty acid desaturase (delta-12 desaturase)
VDRSFGPLLDHTFHHIVDTHVCHHLFSTMPFYHAQEATRAIRKVGGNQPKIILMLMYLGGLWDCCNLILILALAAASPPPRLFVQVLGPKYYLKDDTPIARALWRSYNDCQFIEDEGGIVFYKNEM